MVRVKLYTDDVLLCSSSSLQHDPKYTLSISMWMTVRENLNPCCTTDAIEVPKRWWMFLSLFLRSRFQPTDMNLQAGLRPQSKSISMTLFVPLICAHSPKSVFQTQYALRFQRNNSAFILFIFSTVRGWVILVLNATPFHYLSRQLLNSIICVLCLNPGEHFIWTIWRYMFDPYPIWGSKNTGLWRIDASILGCEIISTVYFDL